tara:strand:- start:42728 stop:42979 length:252 start_codon:yes stop_codon:yes gene_type:complete
MNKKLSQFITILGLAFIIVSGTVDLDNLFNYENQQVPNYITQENLGKELFSTPPQKNGGAGCAACHAPPEFDIDPNTLNNGII